MNLSQEYVYFELFIMLLKSFKTIAELNLCIRSNIYIAQNFTLSRSAHIHASSRYTREHKVALIKKTLNTYSAKFSRK